MKVIYVISVISMFFSFLTSYAQVKLSLADTMYMNTKSDSIGNYDINCVVIGEVELDNLIYVSYSTKIKNKVITKNIFNKLQAFFCPYYVTYSNGYVTNKNNLSLIKANKKNISNLIYKKDFFAFVDDEMVIKYFIYPQCNDYLRKKLDKTFEYPVSTIKYDTTRYEIDKKQGIYYRQIIFPTKFLLVLMNRTWAESRNVTTSDPPKLSDTSNTYVKFLIPLIDE